MFMKFKNKVYIITGATSGMGRSIALEFAKEGASLMLSGRNKERGEKVRTLSSQKNTSHFFSGDLSLELVNKSLVEECMTTFGRLDGVITNAGMLGLGNITDLPSEDWHKTFQINVHSVYYLLKYSIPEMLKNENGVVVINSSIAAFKSFPNHPAYCASKAAAVALAKQAALDYGPKIRVNAICPGPVDTPFLHDSAIAFPDPKSAVEEAGNSTLMKRLGQPEDIAKLAVFLASDDASWITGCSYTIDGGILTAG